MGAKQMCFDEYISDFAEKGIAIMASSSANEISRLDAERKASIFTVALADSIINYKNCKKGYLSLGRIYDGMMDEIKVWNLKNADKQQNPIYRSSIGGDLNFKVEEYEKYNQPVKIYTIEYLILVEGGNKNLSEKELSALLKKSMEYEVYFRTHNADEVQKALKEGVIG